MPVAPGEYSGATVQTSVRNASELLLDRVVEDVVDEVNEPIVETRTVPVRRTTKYVKATKTTKPKITKGKVVRSTK